MNWVKRIRKLLGWFWSNAFSNFDFIKALSESWAVMAKVHQARVESAENGQYSVDSGYYAMEMPFVIHVRKRKLVVDSTGNGTFQECIRHLSVPLSSIFSGDDSAPSLGDKQEDGVFVGEVREHISEPLFMTNHVVTYSKTLFDGFDYIVKDDHIYFKVDPAVLELDQAAHIDEDGTMSIDYVLYGWPYPTLSEKHHVSTFETDGLNKYADIVWDMHQNGATEMNAKRLLCAVTGNALCKADGTVRDLWTEQGKTCVSIDGNVYVSDSPVSSCNFTVGESVHKGDILFNTVSYSQVEGSRHATFYVAAGAVDDDILDKCIRCIDNNTDKSVVLTFTRTAQVQDNEDLP